MRKLFSVVMVMMMVLFVPTAKAQEAKAPKRALRILSWCHSPEARAVAFVTDHPGIQVKWNAKCHFTKGSDGNGTTRSQSRSGIVRGGKWGFTYRLALLWAGKGFKGSCVVTAQGGGREWKRTLSFGGCKVPRTTSVRGQVSVHPMRKGYYKRVIVRVRSAAPNTLVKWQWNCRFTKGSSSNGSVSTKSKTGQFRTGKYRFVAKWHLFGHWWSKFGGTCVLTYQIAQVRKTFKVLFGHSKKRTRRSSRKKRRWARRPLGRYNPDLRGDAL